MQRPGSDTPQRMSGFSLRHEGTQKKHSHGPSCENTEEFQEQGRKRRFSQPYAEASKHEYQADCVWSVMVHAQKPDFILRWNGRVSPKEGGGVSSVDYWQPRCAHLRYLCWIHHVPRQCEEYWLPTPFASFPFNFPPVRHRVPSHSNWSLLLSTH
jgi:hypothetical protein